MVAKRNTAKSHQILFLRKEFEDRGEKFEVDLRAEFEIRGEEARIEIEERYR